MKTKHLSTFFIGIFIIINSFSLKAQTDAIDFILGGISDGEKLIQAYLEPLGNSLGSNLNAGWYNTAKVHNTLGFDITLTVAASIPPETAKTFDVSALGLTNLVLKDPANTLAPTFAGDSDKGPVLVYNNPAFDQPLFEFEMIGGYNIPAYPLPMVKAAVGLPKGIEIMGRFLPKLSYEDMSVGLWGAGIKYDVWQHVPIASRVPFINASIMGAYTSVSSSAAVDFQKSRYPNVDGAPIPGGQDQYDNQKLEVNLSGFTSMAIFSVDLPVICFYAGLGYAHALTNVDLLGDYPVITVENMDDDPQIVIQDVYNPISLEYNGISGFRLNGGLRLKFAVITLHADYTYSDYSMVTAGIGFSFR